jgi:hypothetical protein
MKEWIKANCPGTMVPFSASFEKALASKNFLNIEIKKLKFKRVKSKENR